MVFPNLILPGKIKGVLSEKVFEQTKLKQIPSEAGFLATGKEGKGASNKPPFKFHKGISSKGAPNFFCMS